MTPFDPYQFFLLGQSWLSREGNDEAVCRTVTNRAYYACFLTARDQLFGVDRTNLSKKVEKQLAPKGGIHAAVIVAVARAARPTPGAAKTLSDQLNQLKHIRSQADYVRDITNSRDVFQKYRVASWPELARVAMTMAANLLPSLQGLSRYGRT